MDGQHSDERVVCVKEDSRPLYVKYRTALVFKDAKVPPTQTPSCFCVRFSSDDSYLAASYSHGVLNIFLANTGELESTVTCPHSSSSVAVQIRWKPNSDHLISAVSSADYDGQVMHWHAGSGKMLHNLTERGNQIYCIDYLCDGSRFATAGQDRKVRIYDDKTKQCLHTLYRGDGRTTVGHSNHIYSVRCHPAAAYLLFSGGWDNTVQMWDTRQEKSFRSISNCCICGDTLDFDPSREQILTGSWRTSDALQIWDFGTGRLVESLKNRTESPDTASLLFSAQFSKDGMGSMIAAGGFQTNEAKLYSRMEDGEVSMFGAVVGFSKPIYSLDFANNSRSVALGASDGFVRVLGLTK